jgi:carboxyl-terminal processing protease
MIRLVTLALVSLAALAPTAPAAEEKPATPRPFVVIVGAGQFADPQIKPRPTAEADAKAFYDLFTDKQYFNASPDRVRLLLAGGDADRKAKPATRANVLDALKAAVAESGKDDPVVVVLVGQGASVGERTTCYFTSDATFKDRAKNALSAADVKTALEKLKSEKFCVLLDINYKGFDAGKESVLEPNLSDILKAVVGGNDKDEDGTLPAGRAVFLASRSAKASTDLDKHGLFTSVVLDGLKGKADKDGYEADGVVTVDELTTYLGKEFAARAREAGKTKEQREQTPLEVTGPNSHFVLTQNPAVTPAVEKQLAALAKLEADRKLAPAVAAEGKKLLSQMPKLKAQQELRKEFQKLVAGTLMLNDFLTAREKVLAGMQIKADEAEKFANGVFEGIDVLKEGYVKDVSRSQFVVWAIRGLFKRLEEKVPGDLREKLEKAKDLKKSELADLLIEARTHLGNREDLADGKDIDTALQAMMSGNTDPYTTYIDKEELTRFKTEIDGRFTGIGIQIRRDIVRDALLVVSPIKGSPAYRAGLQAGDLITEIVSEYDNKTGEKLEKPETLTTKGLEVTDAVKKILGMPGVKLKLKVVRDGVKEPLDVELTRGLVEVETVLGAKRNTDDSWDYYIDPKEKIAYIRLTQFGPKSAKDMEEAVKKISKMGVRGLVLDLRFNPGGLLTAAVSISDLFIEDGLIVSIRPRVGSEKQYGGEKEGSHLDFPMAVMVNGGSASGSEIVAAALQDHGRAVIVGERSYGKGSVQNIQDFPSREAKIKLTTASFWRPSGKNLSKAATKGTDEEDWGVRPDPDFALKLDSKESEGLFEHLRDQEIIQPKGAGLKKEPKEFRDRQLDLAVNYLKSQIRMAAKAPTKKAG